MNTPSSTPPTPAVVPTVAIARQAERVLGTHGPTPALSPAESVFRRLVLYIREFEQQLDRDHEVGGRMVSFGANIQFHIVDIGFWGPDIITFDGIDDNGSRVKLIQNVSQLNVLLVALRKATPEGEPRRIGFVLEKRGAAAAPGAPP